MVDIDNGEPGGVESSVAELLNGGEFEIVDIEGVPTATLEDTLALVSAMYDDTKLKSYVGWLSWALIPVDEAVRNQVRRHASDIRTRNPFEALEATRIVGENFADELAQLEGFEGYGQYGVAQTETEHMKYFPIVDGGFYFALEELYQRGKIKLDDVLGLIDDEDENDEIFDTYFKLMNDQFRVSLPAAFECIDPTLMLEMYPDEDYEKIVLGMNAMSSFLEANGYDPNFSRVRYIGLQPDQSSGEN